MNKGDGGMKESRLVSGTGVLLLVAALLVGGCGPDPKERIAMLEDSNQALTDELNRTGNDLAQCRGELDACQQDLTAARSDAAGARRELESAPAETIPDGWQAVPGGAMIAIEGWALFDSGKATIQSGSTAILDLIADTLNGEYPTKDVLVFGHTDSDQPAVGGQTTASGWKDNWELSAQRALSVVRYLASHDIAPKRLVACGCGEHRPRVPNDSTRSKQKNRRVEIFVLDPQSRTGVH